ncbi:hypothetical protein OY671_011084 [Metschnikowia pulcherrima]|nr:hypothetical protein OY671_011084 [Metschnikowia pulcherrima]
MGVSLGIAGASFGVASSRGSGWFPPEHKWSAMGSAGGSPVGVQVVAGRYREDSCSAAGEVIEAAGPAVEIAEPVAR